MEVEDEGIFGGVEGVLLSLKFKFLNWWFMGSHMGQRFC